MGGNRMNAYEARLNATSTHLATWYVVPAEEDQGEENQVAGDGTDSAGEGTAPTADHAAADG